MVRPRAKICDRLFMEYCESGYNDCQIAEKLGTSRMTVARKRMAFGLEANTRRGVRGLSMHGDELYWRWVDKALSRYPELSRIMKETAAELFESGSIDYPTYFLCMGPGPMNNKQESSFNMGHGYRSAFIDLPGIEHIIKCEKRVDFSSLAAAPGPEFINLARVFKTAPKETIRILAEAAIINSGLVNIHTRLDQVSNCRPLSSYDQFWEQLHEDTCGWLEELLDTHASFSKRINISKHINISDELPACGLYALDALAQEQVAAAGQ